MTKLGLHKDKVLFPIMSIYGKTNMMDWIQLLPRQGQMCIPAVLRPHHVVSRSIIETSLGKWDDTDSRFFFFDSEYLHTSQPPFPDLPLPSP